MSGRRIAIVVAGLACLAGAGVLVVSWRRPDAPAPTPREPGSPSTPVPLPAPTPAAVDPSLEILDALKAAVRSKSVWKDEIRRLIQLEDLAFADGALRGTLLRMIADPATGRNLAGLLTFVLTAAPTDPGRVELANLLGKVAGHDPSICYAVTIQNPRIQQGEGARVAFWKGCMSFMEREELLTLGFRDRLFREEYGRSLEEVQRREPVRPSAADHFDGKILEPFHALRKKGFSLWIEPNDPTRATLVEYLVKGESPEAKRAICHLVKQGPDLTIAAREAFMTSQPYHEYVRRGLLNRATEGGQEWEALWDLLPFAGALKHEMIQRMGDEVNGRPDRQEKTLALLRKELAAPSLTDKELSPLMHALSEIRSEGSEQFLVGLCRSSAPESLRSWAVSSLQGRDLAAAFLERRVSCAEEALLGDPSVEVRRVAAIILGDLADSGGKVMRKAEAWAQVRTLVTLEKLSDRDAEFILEALDK